MGRPLAVAGRGCEGLANSAGYAKVFTFDNLEDMTNGIDEALAAEGPLFVHLLVQPGNENTPVAFRTRVLGVNRKAVGNRHIWGYKPGPCRPGLLLHWPAQCRPDTKIEN